MKAGVVVAVLVLALAVPASAAPGDLDPTFDGDGIALTDPIGVDAVADVAVQDDGKVVVVGTDLFEAVVVRFDVDGQPDPTFSDDGVTTVRYAPGGSGHSAATAVAVDGEGRIVVAGRLSGRGPAVARLTADGAPDPTFSDDGRHVFPEGPQTFAEDVVVDGADRVLFAGWGLSCEGGPRCFEFEGSRMLLGRLSASGRPDPTFSGDGILRLNLSEQPDVAHGVALAAGGRILVAGRSDGRAVVLRRLRGGGPDPTFGRDGVARVDVGPGSGLAEIAVGPGEAIAAVGHVGGIRRPSRLAVVRLRPDGGPVRAFDGDGRLVQDLGRGSEQGVGVTFDGDGRLVVGGTIRVGEDVQRGVVLRYLPSGALDAGFSGNGWSVVDPSPGRDDAAGLALDPDGRLVLGLHSPQRLGAARLVVA